MEKMHETKRREYIIVDGGSSTTALCVCVCGCFVAKNLEIKVCRSSNFKLFFCHSRNVEKAYEFLNWLSTTEYTQKNKKMMRNQKKTVCARVSTQTCVWEKEKMLETKTRPGKNENKFSFVWHKRAQWLIFSFAFSLYVRLFLKCFHIGWKKMLIYGASNENLYIYTMCELWLLFVVCDFFFLRVCVGVCVSFHYFCWC